MVVILLWIVFIILWVGYPAYFLKFRLKSNQIIYKFLLLLLAVVGGLYFIGKADWIAPKWGATLIFSLNFLVFFWYFLASPSHKNTWAAKFDQTILAAHLFLGTLTFCDAINFRVFGLSDDQTGSLVGTCLTVPFVIYLVMRSASKS